MGSARGMCSNWDSLHVCVSVSLLEKMSKETRELPGRRRGLVKRGPPFCTGGNRVAHPPETRACSELRTGYRGRVYCTGLLSYVSRKEVCGIDSWEYSTVLRVRVCPTCLGTKGLNRRSYAYAYALLYVGFWLLSYVARKLQLLTQQSVLYVQKSVRNL